MSAATLILLIYENLTFDVSDVGQNPYVGLAGFTYDTRDYYGGREQQVRDALQLLTAPGEEVVLLSPRSQRQRQVVVCPGRRAPALEEHYAQRRQQVRWAVMRPQADSRLRR